MFLGGISMEITLLKRIEGLREKLYDIGLNRNLIDPEVIQVSQQLDQLLNQYHRIISCKQISYW
jgi:hypothetical protein